MNNNSCCCAPPKAKVAEDIEDKPVVIAPKVSTKLTWADKIGRWKARWGIGRMKYSVRPGLYRVGFPNDKSPVLVSANYKLSFDSLRSQLKGMDAWILVLDTKGINVWCSAGKGTFSTEELVRRIEAVNLKAVVSHRKIILPQLSAPGVKGYQVKELSGFRAIFGPIRAEDIREFLANKTVATPEMRRVRFTIWDRLKLVPMEISGFLKYFLIALAIVLAIGGLNPRGWTLESMLDTGVKSGALLFIIYLVSALLFPILLPYLPGRAFSIRGAGLGILTFLAILLFLNGNQTFFHSWLEITAWLLLFTAIPSFITMNFTGAST
jgi:hypothetical protein